MGEQKSSGTPPPTAGDGQFSIHLGVKVELPMGQLVQLPGPQFGYDFTPELDSHAVDTQGLCNAAFVTAEMPDYVFFEHPPSISMLYLEYKNDLQAESYAGEMETMGQRIKMLRQAKGWTQQQLGERVGVSKVAVYQWEVGTTSDIKLKTFQKLVEELGTNSHYLLFGPEAPRTQPRRRSQP